MPTEEGGSDATKERATRVAIALCVPFLLAVSACSGLESAAIDFVRNAYGYLKAIAVDQGGQTLLKIANVGQDVGVVNANDKDAFIAAAKTRQWEREKSVRPLA
jgi:hypothetical protein